MMKRQGKVVELKDESSKAEKPSIQIEKLDQNFEPCSFQENEEKMITVESSMKEICFRAKEIHKLDTILSQRSNFQKRFLHLSL